MSERYYYPINLHELAQLVSSRGIDLAPTRVAWERTAAEVAASMGEQGREVFHTIAAVWPSYSRHDSELCYSRALRTAQAADRRCSHLRWACRQHHINLDTPRLRQGKPQACVTSRKPTAMPRPVDTARFEASQPRCRNILGLNGLTDMLLRLYPSPEVLTVLTDYCVGFQAFLSGGVMQPLIYWQIDRQRRLINGKSIQYGEDAHRNKQCPPTLLYPGNAQCLYGLHRLQDGDRVAIVESEKSCLIMSLEMPQLRWMAVGGLNLLNERMLQPVKGHEIILFPDLDPENDKQTHTSRTHALWLREAKKLARAHYHIGVSDFLESHCSTYDRLQKHDIADFFLNDRIRRFQQGKLNK